MRTAFAFLDMILGYTPMVGLIAAFALVLWAATKLFPQFDEWMTVMSDRLFGVNAEITEKPAPTYNPYHDYPVITNRW